MTERLCRSASKARRRVVRRQDDRGGEEGRCRHQHGSDGKRRVHPDRALQVLSGLAGQRRRHRQRSAALVLGGQEGVRRKLNSGAQSGPPPKIAARISHCASQQLMARPRSTLQCNDCGCERGSADVRSNFFGSVDHDSERHFATAIDGLPDPRRGHDCCAQRLSLWYNETALRIPRAVGDGPRAGRRSHARAACSGNGGVR